MEASRALDHVEGRMKGYRSFAELDTYPKSALMNKINRIKPHVTPYKVRSTSTSDDMYPSSATSDGSNIPSNGRQIRPKRSTPCFQRLKHHNGVELKDASKPMRYRFIIEYRGGILTST
jgi:hypothetical protein